MEPRQGEACLAPTAEIVAAHKALVQGANLFVAVDQGANLFVAVDQGANLFVCVDQGANLFVCVDQGANLFCRGDACVALSGFNLAFTVRLSVLN
jgi:predicted ribosome-associated RNA-binding protein Tma20